MKPKQRASRSRAFLLTGVLLLSGCAEAFLQKQGAKSFPLPPGRLVEMEGATPQQRDFLYLAAMVEDAFPRFRDRMGAPGEYEELKRNTLTRLTRPMEDSDFRAVLNGFLAPIENSHTAAAEDAGATRFPVRLAYAGVGEELYLSGLARTLDPALLGARVLEVNGVPAAAVLREMATRIPGDNRFGRYAQAASYLSAPELAVRYGTGARRDSLHLSVEVQGGGVRDVSVGAVPKEEVELHPDRRSAAPVQPQPGPFHYQILPEQKVAYLRMATFLDRTATMDGVDDYVRPWARPLARAYVRRMLRRQQNVVFRDMLAEMFARIHREEVRTLVVDLRGNRGGDGRLGKQLLYFVETPAPLRDYSRQVHVSTLYRMQFPREYQRLGRAYRARHGGLLPDGVLVDGETDGSGAGFFAEIEDPRSPMHVATPPHRFGGRIYLLVDAGTRSAAMMLATLVRDNRLGTIVGTPPGDRPSGPTSMTRVPLPETGVVVSIATTVATRPDRARGEEEALVPDVLLPLRGEDLQAGRDARLEWVLERTRPERR